MIPNQNVLRSPDAVAAENARFMTNVYTWMTFGLLTTFAIAYYISTQPDLIGYLVQNRIVFYGMIIAQFAAVIYLSVGIQRMSAATATLIYFGYAALTGCTFSTIFLIYTQDSISNVFLITSGAFAGLSAFGFFTKKDLGPIGTFCGMAVFGIIGFYVISMFVPSLAQNQGLQQFVAIGGVLIFPV